MRISPILKFLSIAMLSTFNVVLAAPKNGDSCSADLSGDGRCEGLPKGCESYQLISGTLNKPTTILFGGAHTVECDKASVKCSKALADQQDKNDNIRYLFERAPHDRHLLCTEGLPQKPLSDDCRGWNLPYALNEAKLKTTLKPETFNAILTLVSEAFLEIMRQPKTKHREMAQAKMKELIRVSEMTSNNALNKHKKLYNDFKKTHPTIPLAEFHSDHLVEITQSSLFVEYAKQILAKVEKGILLNTILNDFTVEMNKIDKEMEALYLNPNSLHLDDPNKYLLFSIRTARKEGYSVFAYAGSKHVNPAKASSSYEKESALSLQKNLQNFADANPFAILDCTLNQELYAQARNSRSKR